MDRNTSVHGPRVGSLFTGYGGLDAAVHAVLGGRTAWVSEIAPDACRVLNVRAPGIPNLGDITKVDWSTVPSVDVLVGGFPCQDVSVAGRRAGIADGTRSGLWSHFRDAIAALRPPLVLIENVRGLLSARAARSPDAADPDLDPLLAHLLEEADRAEDTTDTTGHDVGPDDADVGDDDGRPVLLRALGAVLGDLADIGYDAAWHGLRAADVGAPHGRYRIFILARPSTPDADSETRGRDEPGGLAPGPTPGALRQAGRGTGRGGGALAALSGAGAPADANGQGLEGPQPARGRHLSHGGAAADTDGERARRDPRGLPGQVGAARWSRVDVHAPVDAGGDAGAVSWGPYEPAIRRWEHLTGRPAPKPTEVGPKGGPRLSARFVEWMLGLPDGWVTDPAIWAGTTSGGARNAQLKMLGNGVVPQQGAAALAHLLQMWAAADRESAA